MLFYAMLYCSAVMQRCFFSYNSVVLFFMLVYKIIMLCYVLLCWFVMFLYCFVQNFFSLLQWHHGTLQLKVFIPTPVSHNIYLRSQPTQSTPLFGTTQMTQKVSFTHDTSNTYISSFSQCTKLKVSLTTQVPVTLTCITPDTIHTCLPFPRRWPKAFPKDL